MNRLTAFIFIIFFSVSLYSQRTQQFGEIGSLKLENGNGIENCKIGFRTLGKLNSEKSNVIIYPTWFGGTTYDMLALLGPDKLVDTTEYFVILIDALGNGISTSPSNSLTQPNEKFPVFSIHDMVVSEYLLLTKVLGINHIYAAVGGSMGSMQVFDWLVSYPDFMDKAVPYVSTPQITPYDVLHWSMRVNTIETGHKYGVSEREIMKSVNLMNTLLGKSPESINKDHNLTSIVKFLSDQDREPSKIFTSYDFAAQIRAMLQHDIARKFDNSLEKAAKSIKAKTFLILAETDLMVNNKTAVEIGKMLNSEILMLDNKCGHLAVGCELSKCSQAIKTFLKKP